MELKNVESKTTRVEKTVKETRPEIILFMGTAHRVPANMTKGEYMKQLRQGL